MSGTVKYVKYRTIGIIVVCFYKVTEKDASSTTSEQRKNPMQRGRGSNARNGYAKNVDALGGLNDEIFQSPAMRLRYSVGEEGHHLVAMLRLIISHGESGQKRVGDFATR